MKEKTTVKWRKTRNKQEWKSNTGVRIVWNVFFQVYQIERRTFFGHAKTLEEAKRVAETDYHFQ